MFFKPKFKLIFFYWIDPLAAPGRPFTWHDITSTCENINSISQRYRGQITLSSYFCSKFLHAMELAYQGCNSIEKSFLLEMSLKCTNLGIIRNLTVSKWDLKWFYKPKLLQLNFLPALPVRVRRSHLGNVRLETCREQVMSQPNVTVVGVARKQRNWEGHQGRAHIWNLGLMFFDPKAPLFEAYFPTYLLTHCQSEIGHKLGRTLIWPIRYCSGKYIFFWIWFKSTWRLSRKCVYPISHLSSLDILYCFVLCFMLSCLARMCLWGRNSRPFFWKTSRFDGMGNGVQRSLGDQKIHIQSYTDRLKSNQM